MYVWVRPTPPAGSSFHSWVLHSSTPPLADFFLQPAGNKHRYLN